MRGADWQRHRPIVVVVEATLPFSNTPAWEEWDPYLVNECGYLFVYFDGLNRFYVRNEDAQLQSGFAFPPNVLDGFTHWTTAALQAELQETKAELAQTKQQLAEAVRQDVSAPVTALLARANEVESQVDSRSSDLEAKFSAAQSRFDSKISALEIQFNTAVTALESDLDAKVSALESELAGKRALLSDRVARYASTASDLGLQMESQVSALSSQINGLQAELSTHTGELAKQVQELQQRLHESRLWVGQLSQALAAARR